MKHTKGKWEFGRGIHSFLISSDNRSVGKTWSKGDEDEANAKLICKAPEMAVLLKKIFDSKTVSGPEVAKIVTTTDTIIELESLINEIES